MSVETWGMIGAGIAALVAGLFFVRARFAAASGAGRVLVLGPAFKAVALAICAAEHFLAAHDLMGIVPRWLPGPLFSGPISSVRLCWRRPQLHHLAVCALVSVPTRTTVPDHRRHNRPARPTEELT